MDKIDRVMEITDWYLERFGKVLIGIYYLPALAENWKFAVFINSLLVTLRRMDLMPCYTWFMDTNGGHFLILWLNGYFRHDLSEITPTVSRLWQIHTQTPLTVVDCIPILSEAPEYGKRLLSQFLYSHGLSHPITANWHQRTFGTSRLR
jgi:hypothetical protein